MIDMTGKRFHKILYDTCRELTSVNEKLSVAVLFLFCYQLSDIKYAELLYCDDIDGFVKGLKKENKFYDEIIAIDLKHPNIKNSFRKTKEKCIEVFDKDGFYKAVYDKDEFALVIVDIVKTVMEKFNHKDFIKNTKEIFEQKKQ